MKSADRHNVPLFLYFPLSSLVCTFRFDVSALPKKEWALSARRGSELFHAAWLISDYSFTIKEGWEVKVGEK